MSDWVQSSIDKSRQMVGMNVKNKPVYDRQGVRMKTDRRKAVKRLLKYKESRTIGG